MALNSGDVLIFWGRCTDAVMCVNSFDGGPWWPALTSVGIVRILSFTFTLSNHFRLASICSPKRHFIKIIVTPQRSVRVSLLLAYRLSTWMTLMDDQKCHFPKTKNSPVNVSLYELTL
jgi:hypothetical protein